MSNKRTFHIVVSGRVQGVGFRYFVKEKALEYKLTGWVKNRPNGSVEIEVEGNTPALDIFTEFLKIGNGYSRVDQMSKTEIPASGNHKGFQIKF